MRSSDGPAFPGAQNEHVDANDELDLAAVLADLSGKRRVFHSERDFQFALAWETQLRYASARIRLEPRARRGIHLDMLLVLDGRRIAVELKYLVRGFAGAVDGEDFDLPDQGAHDISRYDVVKDVVRVERLLGDGYADTGYVVVLSSDPMYWRPGVRTDTVDAAFRIHETRTLAGVLAWDRRAGAGTTANREAPLALAGRYPCRWRDYATLDGGLVSLRYLMLPVTTASAPAEPPAPPATAPRVQPPRPRSGGTAREQILTRPGAWRPGRATVRSRPTMSCPPCAAPGVPTRSRPSVPTSCR